eukprot:3176868-Prymnesium_polylepis.1
MHTAIHDMIVLTFKNEDDILDEMIAHECGADGPACFAYLEAKYNSTTLAAAVRNLGTVMREPIAAPDQIAGI